MLHPDPNLSHPQPLRPRKLHTNIQDRLSKTLPPPQYESHHRHPASSTPASTPNSIPLRPQPPSPSRALLPNPLPSPVLPTSDPSPPPLHPTARKGGIGYPLQKVDLSPGSPSM
ncbi:hypothetical protein K456DRAFT_1036050 [Colletotrichum gloeosporioides 23]|nr:hypothetical protein K456DRAFT_1036050 [Colletotrichum gloeosporioides 23]